MHEAPLLQLMDVIGPLIAALAFVSVMSLVTEPVRRNLNAVLVAGAALAYLSGGFGLWELAFPAIFTPVAYLALRSYRYIGLGWLMHAGWDVLHHFHGNPIWPFMPTSSFGCLLFDSAIAVWFLAGAPSMWRRRARDAALTEVAATTGPPPRHCRASSRVDEPTRNSREVGLLRPRSAVTLQRGPRWRRAQRSPT